MEGRTFFNAHMALTKMASGPAAAIGLKGCLLLRLPISAITERKSTRLNSSHS
jgi:hypothetical protein